MSSIIYARSLIISRKNNGPKTLPWGTPRRIDIRGDIKFFKFNSLMSIEKAISNQIDRGVV